MKNLKETAKELSNDINNNNEWLNKEISFVIDGSYETYSLNQDINELYDINKPNRGKRNNNLVARVGNILIQKAYNCNNNQALKVWHYLTEDEQIKLTNDVRDNLDLYYEMIGE